MENEVNTSAQKPEKAETSTPTDNKGSEVVSETKHSNNKVLVIVLVVIGAFIVLGAASALLVGRVFKDAATTMVEEATGTSITTDNKGTTTVTDANGSVTASTEQKLPDSFPSSIPLYASQTITDSYKSKNTMGTYWQVSAKISDSVKTADAKLKDLYKNWELVSEIENDGVYNYSYKDSKYDVNLTVSENNNQTTITYMVSEVMATE